MGNKHLVVIHDPRSMAEVPDESVQLIATSPPVFEIKESFDDLKDYLEELRLTFKECYRVLERGRYICVNVCDIVSRESKYPIPAHYVLLLQRAGFEYRDDIIWRKPKTSGKRFGVFVEHPYPMYYFPNNVLGHILVLRKGEFDYKNLTDEDKLRAAVDLGEARRRWNSDIWDMRWEVKNPGNSEHPIVFPDELPEALIRLYTFEGETVLDPFLGSGTVTRVAASMGRKSIGYAPDRSCLPSLGIVPGGLETIEQKRCSQ